MLYILSMNDNIESWIIKNNKQIIDHLSSFNKSFLNPTPPTFWMINIQFSCKQAVESGCCFVAFS